MNSKQFALQAAFQFNDIANRTNVNGLEWMDGWIDG